MHAIIKPASPFLNPGLTHLSHILAVVHLARSGNPRSQDTFAQIHKTQIQIWMVWLTWGSHWWCTWSSLEIPGHKVQRLIGRVWVHQILNDYLSKHLLMKWLLSKRGDWMVGWGYSGNSQINTNGSWKNESKVGVATFPIFLIIHHIYSVRNPQLTAFTLNRWV